MMSNSLSLEIHINKNSVSQSDKSTSIYISIDLRILAESGIYYMFSTEFGSVFVETIGYEDGNIIGPSIARSGGQQNPVVILSNLKK